MSNGPGLVLQEQRAAIEHALGDLLAHAGEENRLAEACRYAMLGGGKRVRPVIVLLMARARGAKHPVMKAALATEFFHTASLIADDLPCMDDALERRGRPALHRAYGEDVALLASYALISEGFRAITANALELERLVPGHAWDRVGLLAVENATRNLGLEGVTGGQFLDLHPPDDSEASLQRLLHLKTATLFEISFVFGWLFGGGDPTRLAEVGELARHFGLAFQLADDLDDFAEDAANGRPNYAVSLGAARATEQLERSTAAFDKLAGELDLDALVFRDLLGTRAIAASAA